MTTTHEPTPGEKQYTAWRADCDEFGGATVGWTTLATPYKGAWSQFAVRIEAQIRKLLARIKELEELNKPTKTE